MLISNEKQSMRGTYSNDKMWTALLIGENNSRSSEISIQITHIEPEGRQGLHSHPEDQCYFIIEGVGIMHIENESQNVRKGDAIFIKGGDTHGITNNGTIRLSYLTANKAFGIDRERQIWNEYNCGLLKNI